MEHTDSLKALGLFDARVPRYTSYPTAAVFSPNVGSAFQKRALEALDPDVPVSVYIHIPFCERLCWFCACHTQGTQTLGPVESYIETLEAELDMLRGTLPVGLRMGRLHWGGGTPTIDPTMVDRAKIDALAAEGMTRASIGIQDFDPEVQQAIGRLQPFGITRACVEDLRAAGITSLNTDLVYGLPHQTLARIEDTIDKVLTFAPDRIALFGYAHVPWVSKRQKLIDESALPGDLARYTLATRAAERFVEAGLVPIGIDHFAAPGDDLAVAHDAGRLRRNFQGYTADSCQTLIGLGASSISRFPGGYVQNAPATAAYKQRIAQAIFPGSRGYEMTADDQLHARAIETLMCYFALDLDDLSRDYGPRAYTLRPCLEDIETRFKPFARLVGQRISIAPEGRSLTRIIASMLDQHVPEGVRYSQAS
jgi:oxygen-independent coproporphyrinogen-3 oxidase